jgi:hypothetical protein
MLAAGGDLPVVQVQFGFIGPLHQHGGPLLPLLHKASIYEEIIAARLLEQMYHFMVLLSRGRTDG